MRIKTLLFVAFALLASMPVMADQYVWTDGHGVVWQYEFVDENDPLQGVTMSTTVTNSNIESLSGRSSLPTEINFNGLTSQVIGISLTFADEVTSIPEGAFSYNENLTSIAISASLTSIGLGAFSGSSGLNTIIIDPDNQKYTSRGTVGGVTNTACNAIIEKGTDPGTDTDTYTLIRGCNSTIIPEDVTSINPSAFSDCKGLKSITIPASVVSIGSGAFDGCGGLESISVAAGNTTYDSRNNCNAIIETETNTLVRGCANTVFPDNISAIGNYAFRDCSNLESVTLPASVTSIGAVAFGECHKLTSVSIPASVTISDFAFLNCKKLATINMPNVTAIANQAFSGCNSLEAVALPESLTSIGTNPFEYCSSLTSIVVDEKNAVYTSRGKVNANDESDTECNAIIEKRTDPDTNTESNTLIVGCAGTTIPETVTSIGAYAFSSCYGLTEITIPSSITNIGSYAFRNCTKLTSVISNIATPFEIENVFEVSGCTLTVPQDTKQLYKQTAGWNVFDGGIFEVGENPIKEYSYDELKYSLNWINNEASVAGLVDGEYSGALNIPATINVYNEEFKVTSIGCAAFEGKSITSVTIPEHVVKICDFAFMSCESLTSVTIQGSLIEFGQGAFSRCSNLESINIPETVTLIAEHAFWYCSKLQSLSIPASVKTIEEGAFNGCCGLTSITVAENNEKYTSRDGNGNECNALIQKESEMLLLGCTNTTIPGNIKHIGTYAFSDQSMDTFSIPDNITTIGNGAFSNCKNLSTITIPSSLIGVGYGVFEGCTSLTTAAPASQPSSVKAFRSAPKRTNELQGAIIPETVTEIGEKMFAYCNNLPSIVVDENNTVYTSRGTVNGVSDKECNAIIESSSHKLVQGCNSTVIPDEVTTIGKSAFQGCNRTSITLPAGLTGIENNAFEDCSSLTSVVSNVTVPFSFGEDAFKNISSDCILTIPNGTKDAYTAAGWTTDIFKGGVCETQNPSTTSYLYIDDNGIEWRFVLVDESDPSQGVTMSTTVTSENIGSGYSNGIESPSRILLNGTYVPVVGVSLTISDDVTSIPDGTFYNCPNLTSFFIPKTVTKIGNDLYPNCDRLTSIVIDPENPVYDSRENCNAIIETASNKLFLGCGATVIPNGVELINAFAFCHCCDDMTSLTIPASVTKIEDKAFCGCGNLTSITVAAANEYYTSRGKVNANDETDTECNAIIDKVEKKLIQGCGNTVIPDGVIKIGDMAFNRCGIKAVTIPESVTSIGEQAFASCESLITLNILAPIVIPSYTFNACGKLTTVYMPYVTGIDIGAFSHCGSLTSITLPASLNSIGNTAFEYCDNLTTIKVDEGDGNGKYTSRGKVDGDDNTECNAIIEKATNTLVVGCAKTKVPETVTSIGEYAFKYCHNLTSITIPAAVESIGDAAFQYCSGLTSIVSNIEEPFQLGEDVFTDYPDECTLTVPVGTRQAYKDMGWNIFKGGIYEGDEPHITQYDDGKLLYALNRINNTATVIAKEGGYSNLGDLVIPKTINVNEVVFTVTSIAEISFAGSEITSVVIPETVTDIGSGSFANCSNMVSVNIWGAVSQISDYAFAYCNVLENVSLPNSVTSINFNAFTGCGSLSTINIPKSLTTIDEDAFKDCSSLTSLSIPASVAAIDRTAFASCSGLTTITVDAANEKYTSRDGNNAECNAIIEIGTNANTLLRGCPGTTIPETVTRIGDYAFSNYSSMETFSIPDNVTIIGNDAFFNCTALTTVTLPASVDEFGYGAFEGCTSLTTAAPSQSSSVKAFRSAPKRTNGTEGAIIPASATNIGNKMFAYCNNLPSIVVDENNTVYTSRGTVDGVADTECNAIIKISDSKLIQGCNSTVIPSDVTAIGQYAFQGCNSLGSVTLPSGLTSIENNAFEDCSSLTSVVSNITNPFFFGEDAFKNISSSCVLTIPDGTKDAYLAAGWTTSVFGGGVYEASETPDPGTNPGTEYIEISTAQELVAFAARVNAGETSINARLTADIDMDGETYTAIGTGSNSFCGIFDGQGFVISNLTINSSEDNQGLIGKAGDGAIIKNVILDNTCSISGKAYVGGIVGCTVGTLTIQSCGNEGTVTASAQNAGGILGCNVNNSQLTITNCYNSGAINGDSESAGLSGWIGINNQATLTNCYNIGSVTGLDTDDSNNYINTFVRKGDGDEIVLQNCYETIGSQVTQVTSTQVSSGELCYSLNGSSSDNPTWFQTLESDSHPVLFSTHGTVYYENDAYFNKVVQYVDPVTNIVYKPIAGSAGSYNPGTESYPSACDGDTGTKLCVNTENPIWVIIEASEAVSINGYTIITADDNALETSHGRNPKSWTLEGSNDKTSWTMLDNVTDNMTMQDVNFTPYDFQLSAATAAYKYFRFTVTATQGSVDLQYSEFHPRTDLAIPHYDNLALVDGETYNNTTPITEVDNLTYSRTYANSAWLPWYVPFDLALTSEVLNDFSFAKFCGTYTEEDEHGEDVFCITVSKMKSGDVVKANTPYVVKAKTESNDPQVITVTDATLKATAETGFSMYSAEKKITIQGIYSPKTATSQDCDWYFINSTGYVHAQAGQTLGSYRFFLTITDREDNPYASSTKPNNIKMKVLGDDDDATDLEMLPTDEQPTEVYDLSGRRVLNEQLPRGIYIVNGKKVFVR